MMMPWGIITSEDVQYFGVNAYLHTGAYTNKHDRAEHWPLRLREVRFSHMWRRIDGDWRIVHHYSSALPKAAGSSADEEMAEEMYPTALDNFHMFNAGLQARDWPSVASLFSTPGNGVQPQVSLFLSTSVFHSTSTDQQDDLLELVKKLPHVNITGDDIQAFGPDRDAYMHTGTCTLVPTISSEPSSFTQELLAGEDIRFSAIWRRIEGEWKIVHASYYSSLVGSRAASEAKDGSFGADEGYIGTLLWSDDGAIAEMHGNGVWASKDGTRLDGRFANGKFVCGTKTFTCGSRWTGSFHHGRPNGRGILASSSSGVQLATDAHTINFQSADGVVASMKTGDMWDFLMVPGVHTDTKQDEFDWNRGLHRMGQRRRRRSSSSSSSSSSTSSLSPGPRRSSSSSSLPNRFPLHGTRAGNGKNVANKRAKTQKRTVEVLSEQEAAAEFGVFAEVCAKFSLPPEPNPIPGSYVGFWPAGVHSRL